MAASHPIGIMNLIDESDSSFLQKLSSRETDEMRNDAEMSVNGCQKESETNFFSNFANPGADEKDQRSNSIDEKPITLQTYSQVGMLERGNSGGLTSGIRLNNWTLRNSEDFQEEVFGQGYGTCTQLASELGLESSQAAEQVDIFACENSRDESIYVYIILSFAEEVPLDLWNRLKTSLRVTQSVTEQELIMPISRSSFSCSQSSVEIPTFHGRKAREISASIAVKNYLHSTPTRYLFQLFLVATEEPRNTMSADGNWEKIDMVAFVQVPSTGQLLLPIEKKLRRKDALEAKEGVFLGSFFLHDNSIYHHIPRETSLRAREDSSPGSSEMAETAECGKAEATFVDRKDIVLEPNGARGGRPSHRATGQLLMTDSQVEKIYEIRTRWQGLSPRQRRDNVTNADFYTFLTLNRDETAECLGVCATWLKDAIRSQGVSVWPGRPLRRTGAMLQTLKESIESAKAALRFSDPARAETKQYIADIQQYESEIRDLIATRIEIVKANVSKEYFEQFVREGGERFLNPDWNSLPPQEILFRKA